jgi:DNA-binding GntR family transcriptional regulator
MTTLYETIKTSIRERIVNGLYKPGQKIPSESELVRQFGVSAITVRRALRDLTIEGRLVGRQGLGVFVADRPRILRSLNPDFKTSLGDEIRRAGFAPGLRELSLSLAAADPSILDALGVSAAEVVYRHEKVILADATPICFDVTFMPRDLGEALRPDLGADFLLPLLAKHSIAYAYVDYRIEAASAMQQAASVLEVPVGAPLLSVWYYPVSPDNRRLLVGHMLACAEWYSFDLRVPALSSTRSYATPATNTGTKRKAPKRTNTVVA